MSDTCVYGYVYRGSTARWRAALAGWSASRACGSCVHCGPSGPCAGTRATGGATPCARTCRTTPVRHQPHLPLTLLLLHIVVAECFHFILSLQYVRCKKNRVFI